PHTFSPTDPQRHRSARSTKPAPNAFRSTYRRTARRQTPRPRNDPMTNAGPHARLVGTANPTRRSRPSMNQSASIWIRILFSAYVWLFGAFANGQSPPLKQGDGGGAVERLQKLLNARLNPSPELDVDGDFGASTFAALRRFQRQKGLPATGAADSK